MKIGLVLLSIALSKSLFAQDRYDVIIDELMADPTPAVGLPAVEWVELKNKGPAAVNLQGWRLGDEAGLSGPFPAYMLPPDSFVIVCAASSLSQLATFGPAIAVGSFPSLANEGELLYLRAGGKTMHALRYDLNWYGNELKKEGGWSLEMMDTRDPCTGAGNWKASTADPGGSPGKLNSVHAERPPPPPPAIINVYALDSSTLMVEFAGAVDSSTGASLANYQLDGDLRLHQASMPGPLFDHAILRTDRPLTENRIYQLQTGGLSGCTGSRMPATEVIRTGRASEPGKEEWILNEILFDPRPNAYDYVECLNTSPRILDASRLFIGNRNSAGAVASIRPMSVKPRCIFPGDFIVLTEDAASLALQYLVKNPDRVFEVTSLPSFPDDAGTVVLLNGRGEVTDELKYDRDWHFALVTDREGLSLERLNPRAPTQSASNWHSAGSTAGYGTPTYSNSQFRRPDPIAATVAISPPCFSPDNDGQDDWASLQYKITESGWVANVQILDGRGRPVRSLVRNALLGLEGSWVWNGLDDQGRKLPLGVYIVYTDLFNLQGKTRQFKQSIVLARKLGQP